MVSSLFFLLNHGDMCIFITHIPQLLHCFNYIIAEIALLNLEEAQISEDIH